eukprot:g1161.t1
MVSSASQNTTNPTTDQQDDSTDVVSELDSEASKDFREEDEVFHPSSMTSTMADFIGFQDFVKWTQVRDAVETLRDKVSLRHTVAAFATLKGMLPRPPNTYLDSLANTLVAKIDDARSNHIARVFFACGKLRYINPKLLQALSKKCLEGRHVVEMDGCDLSGILHSLGVLSRFQMFVFAAEKGVRAVDLYQMYTKETVPILFDLQPELIRAIANELSTPNRLVGFKEQELAQSVYGLGLLRAPETMALRGLAREISEASRLPKFTAQELSNVIYGYGLVNFKDEALLYGMCNHMIRMKRMPELETQHLANILYGFSRMNFKFEPFIINMVDEIIQPERLKRFKEQELANIVSCSSLIGVKDEAFFKLLGQEIAKPNRLVKYLEHNFSTIVLGFANVGARDVDVLKTLAEEMRRPHRLPNYTSKDICDIIMGFNNLEFMDDGFMLALVAELRKPQRIKKSDTKVWQSCRAHVFSWSLAFPF